MALEVLKSLILDKRTEFWRFRYIISIYIYIITKPEYINARTRSRIKTDPVFYINSQYSIFSAINQCLVEINNITV